MRRKEESDKGGGEEGVGSSKKLKLSITTPKEIEDGIQSSPTVTWDPFKLFPEKIYLKIFDLLDDPNDKQRLMNSHPKLYDLFKPKRTFLLEKVLKVLLKNGRKLRTSDYFNLRLVSREWDASLQRFIQLHPFHFRMDPIRFDGDEILQKSFGWYTADELEAALERISVTHPPPKNPFLTRKIWLRDSDGDAKEDWYTQVDHLLEAYGLQIYHLDFEFELKMTPESLAKLLNWLSLMPELKTLNIRDSEEPEELGKLENLTDQPELAKLSVVKCEGIVASAFNKILKGFQGKLSKILIEGYQSHQVQSYLVPPALQAKLLLPSADYITFQPLPFLRKLTLNFLPKRPQDWSSIWLTLETSPELEELDLTLPKIFKAKAQEQSLNYRLNLPKLRRLRIVMGNLACLNFLSNLNELNELQLELVYSNKNCKEVNKLGKMETVDFFKMGLKNMWHSNIWDVFPKLRKLCVQVTTHDTRTKMPTSSLKVYNLEKKGNGQKTYFKTNRKLY